MKIDDFLKEIDDFEWELMISFKNYMVLYEKSMIFFRIPTILNSIDKSR